jgi:Protein of unknown function (DUF2889)
MSDRPRYVGRSGSADAVASRWDELAATVEDAEPHFERTFRTRIFKREDETLSLTSLDDDFHEMRIALRVAADGSIVEAAGRMNRHPYDTCPRAVESLVGLAGVNVFFPKAGGGWRERVPRSEGCLHLADMLSIAFRAFRIAKGHEIPYSGEEGRREILTLMPHVRDTCVSFAVE